MSGHEIIRGGEWPVVPPQAVTRAQAHTLFTTKYILRGVVSQITSSMRRRGAACGNLLPSRIFLYGRSGAESLDDWMWQKQLRYYVKSGGAIIKMSSARFGYSYEYQGNAPKLVHTPLTDKCYLTLTQVGLIMTPACGVLSRYVYRSQ